MNTADYIFTSARITPLLYDIFLVEISPLLKEDTKIRNGMFAVFISLTVFVNGLDLIGRGVQDLNIQINQAGLILGIFLLIAGSLLGTVPLHFLSNLGCVTYGWLQKKWPKYAGRFVRILADFGGILFILYLPSLLQYLAVHLPNVP